MTIEKKYSLEGMSCEHCVKNVTNQLESLPDVEAAEVSLERKEARLKMKKDLPVSDLQNAVREAGNYNILAD